MKKEIAEGVSEISYLRIEKPPTLEQFLIRKLMREAITEASGVKGVVFYKGRLMPKSAAIVAKKFEGMTPKKIAELHPEWVEEFEKKPPP